MAKGKGKSKNKTSTKGEKASEQTAGTKKEIQEVVKETNIPSEVQSESVVEKTEITNTDPSDEDSTTFVRAQDRTDSQERKKYNKRENRWDFKDSYTNNNKKFQRDYTHSKENNYKSRRSEPVRIGAHNRENGNRNNQRRSLNIARDTDKRPRDRSNDSTESDFRSYEEQFRKTKGEIDYKRTNEIEQDLFMMPGEYSLAHCVAEDMGMGSGIAVTFRYKFKRVEELLNQRQTPGGLAVLQDEDRYIYYLVTKKHSTGKPTYRTLFLSLKKMREHMEEHDVKKLAMPRIGCGLDRLEWDNVKFMIEHVFKDLDVDIVICNLQPAEGSPQSRHRNCKQVNVTYPIQDIEEGTIILYLSSEDGYISEEMKLLDEKFHFLTEFRSSRKRLRDTIIFSRNENYLLVGCIVKKHDTDPIDYGALKHCVTDIMKVNKKYQFAYVGFQAVKDEQDSCINYKIINILRNNFRNVDVYICWPGELGEEMSARDKFNDSFTSSVSDDNDRSRDFSGKKSFGKNSFSQKDKWFDNNDWRNGSKSESTRYGSSQKSLFETNRGTSGSKQDTHWGDTEDVPSSSQESTTKDWFEESTAASSSKQFEKNEEEFCQEEAETSFERKSSKRDNEPFEETIPTSFSENESTPIETCEYEQYTQEPKSGNFTKIKVLDNISNLQEKHSRVCYVSEDMCLQSGIPAGNSFGAYVGKLLSQNQKEGSCVSVEDGRERLYCLIVKQLSNSTCKPKVVFTSIQQLRTQVVKHGVRKLLIPMVNKSKKDPFDWSEVPHMIDFLFRDTRVDVVLAPFQQENYIESFKKRNKVKLNHAKGALFQAKNKSMIIYWASEDGTYTSDMTALSKKFDFRSKFEEAEKRIGTVIRYKDADHVLYGCVVRKTQNDSIDFLALEKCIKTVSDTNKEQFGLASASAVEDPDETINHKIVNILLNNLQNVNISFCWPGSLRTKMPSNSS